MNNLYDLFIKQMADLHCADKLLINSLPDIIRSTNTTSLANAFNNHLLDTVERADRMEKLSQDLGIDLSEGNCPLMRKFLEEADKIMNASFGSPALKDAMIAALAKKVEHYLIASYANIREVAAFLGYGKIARLLNRSMQTERRSDEGITGICITQVFPECEHAINEQEGAFDTDYALRVRA